jgi:biopolymer transport protein ExbD
VPSQIIVYVDAKDNIQIGGTVTNIAGAPATFHDLQNNTNHQFTSVIIKADPKADYGVILQVMDAAKKEDLTNFGLANKTCAAGCK